MAKIRVESYTFDLEDESDIEAYRKCLQEIANEGHRVIENIIFAKKVGDVSYSKKLLTYEKYLTEEYEE